MLDRGSEATSAAAIHFEALVYWAGLALDRLVAQNICARLLQSQECAHLPQRRQDGSGCCGNGRRFSKIIKTRTMINF